MRDFSRLMYEPFSEPKVWRREAIEIIARDLPGMLGIRPSGRVVCMHGGGFTVGSLDSTEWGILLDALTWICHKCGLPWRIQVNDDVPNQDVCIRFKCKARTRGRWYYGETPADALLYAVASSNLLLTPGPSAPEVDE